MAQMQNERAAWAGAAWAAVRRRDGHGGMGMGGGDGRRHDGYRAGMGGGMGGSAWAAMGREAMAWRLRAWAATSRRRLAA